MRGRSPEYVDGLARLGILVNPLPAYDYHMGSYQMSWLTSRLGWIIGEPAVVQL